MLDYGAVALRDSVIEDTVGIGGAGLALKQESPRDPPSQGCFPKSD